MADKNYREDNKSFLVYKDWEEYVNMLTDLDAGRLFKALFVFSSTGKETRLEGMAAMAYAMMRNCIERDGLKWQEICRKNSDNAKKRWDKTKDNNASDATACESMPTDAKNADIDIETETDKEKDKAIAIETDREKDTASYSGTQGGNDFSEVKITDNELDILYGLADRLTIERYLSKIRDWQAKNRRFNSKPYTSIRKWLDEDGVIKEPPRKIGGGFGDYYTGSTNDPDGSISAAAYEAYAASIDFSTLPTTY